MGVLSLGCTPTGPLRQPPPDPVPRPGGRLRRDPPADRALRVPVGLLAGHRHRLHARLRRPLDRAGCSTGRGEFEDHGIKRYDDTILIGDEATLDGIDSPRGARRRPPAQPDPRPLRHPQRRVRLRPRHHDRRPGPLDLAYGWRQLDPHELAAITQVTTRFGELMGIRDLPTTYDGYLALLVDYERRALRPRPRRPPGSTEALDPHRAARSPPRRSSRWSGASPIAIMDEPLREALGLPRAAARGSSARCARGLRLRGRLLRFAPPRRTAYRHRPTTTRRLPARRPRPASHARRTSTDSEQEHHA